MNLSPFLEHKLKAIQHPKREIALSILLGFPADPTLPRPDPRRPDQWLDEDSDIKAPLIPDGDYRASMSGLDIHAQLGEKAKSPHADIQWLCSLGLMDRFLQRNHKFGTLESNVNGNQYALTREGRMVQSIIRRNLEGGDAGTTNNRGEGGAGGEDGLADNHGDADASATRGVAKARNRPNPKATGVRHGHQAADGDGSPESNDAGLRRDERGGVGGGDGDGWAGSDSSSSTSEGSGALNGNGEDTTESKPLGSDVTSLKPSALPKRSRKSA